MIPRFNAKVSSAETPSHRNLKRLALLWARERGFGIGAIEVAAPNLGGCRLDVAAYRAERGKGSRSQDRLGPTMILECKQSRADFLRDSKSARRLSDQLQRLRERRRVYEESMQGWHADLRNGETLFPEFDSYRFAAAGYEPYNNLVRDIDRISARLHANTKFDRLARWKGANLHFIVAEPELLAPHELPANWGLLIRREEGLVLEMEAVWQEATAESRWALLLGIAKSGSKATHTLIDDTRALFPNPS